MRQSFKAQLHRVLAGTARAAVGFALLFAQVAVIPAGHFVEPAHAGGSIVFQGNLPLPDPSWRESDICGWYDPSTGKEYAAVGQWSNKDVFICEVTDPTNPTLVTTIPNIPGFDLKYWGGYLYTVTGGEGSTPGQIWDVTDPSDPDSVGIFPSGHNIYIDANGYMYNEIDGLKIYDLFTTPATPIEVFYDNTFNGHDASITGNILFDYHGWSGYARMWDITDPTAPVQVGVDISDVDITYPHSGDTDVTGNYLYLNDELATSPAADFSVWNISNPAAPVRGVSINDPDATIHNSFRIGNFLYCSYYVAGFKVFDITDPANPVLCDTYDTSPAFTGEGVYEGAWGCWPYLPSGNILISDEQTGLWVFTFEPTPTGIDDEVPSQKAKFVLEQNFPNPFNPITTIAYDLTEDSPVELHVFSARGEHIRTLVSGLQGPGPHSVTWDARNSRGEAVASGTYFYRLKVGSSTETKRMVLLK